MLNKVTVTGADDGTNIEEMLLFAERYPFVEFGILMSKSQANSPRFPDVSWIEKLIDAAKGTSIQLSGHLCGNYVRKVLLGDMTDSDFNNLMGNLISSGLFKRFQLNTHGRMHSYSGKFLDYLDEHTKTGIRFIMQNDEKNNSLINAAMAYPNVDVLFDLSHGAGVLPTSWPKPLGLDAGKRDGEIYCGYAGGLTPENVSEQIEKIESVVAGANYWIDAETWLRNKENKFDLDLVKTFLDCSKQFIK